MKKGMIYPLILLSAFLTSPVQAYDTGRSDAGVFKRVIQVQVRGLLNLVGMPAEIIRTPVEESKKHPRIWPVTFLPRLVNHIFSRAVSAVYDIAVHPFMMPFTDDMTPLTDPMGLTTYPWQIKEYDF